MLKHLTMKKIYSKALEQSIEVDRIIGHIQGAQPGPVNIFLAGIHGNEPSGVFALHQVLQKFEQHQKAIKGSIYAISGNLSALEKGLRYQKQDLNRLWTGDRIQALQNVDSHFENDDQREQIQIYNTIMKILDEHDGPFYFTDLHTTSSQTIPFITVNDTLLNRKFTVNYPVPHILGIEEYLHGPALSYINELGYVAFGFEGGQHDEKKAVDNHIAFIYVTLALTGCIPKTSEYQTYLNHLMLVTNGITGFYEIFLRHKIASSDQFKMQPGFANFQCIKEGSYLADSNNKRLLSPEKARILMPLYQLQGEDGFFLIRRIAPFYLHLSAVLRKVRIDQLLVFLPGVEWQNIKKDGLKVNLSKARLLAKPFFHLLGYRTIKINKKYMLVNSREAASRDQDYRKAEWY
jgi:hypothetical protein